MWRDSVPETYLPTLRKSRNRFKRNRMFIHIVDAASTEGRDPAEDIRKINGELAQYDEKLLGKPQVIAANKTDVLSPEETDEVIKRLDIEQNEAGIDIEDRIQKYLSLY